MTVRAGRTRQHAGLMEQVAVPNGGFAIHQPHETGLRALSEAFWRVMPLMGLGNGFAFGDRVTRP